MNGGESQPLAWWQLLRAGNVFTAISNVIAGYLITQQSWQPIGPLLLMVLSSALLYEAGMVLNDVFDAELDAKERPERPIPSGRISRRLAAVVGWTLLVLGIVTGGLASVLVGNVMAVCVSLALAACIVGYDAGLKSTFLGPWVMGSCRMLNVLLGAFAAVDSLNSDSWAYAVLVGIYAVGLTFFAREENEPGWKLGNTVGALLIAGVTLFISAWTSKLLGNTSIVLTAWLAFHLWIWRIMNWIGDARATSVVLQSAVGRIITGFILVDAFMVYAAMNWQSAAIVLSLLIPTWIASRWAPMT